MEELTAEGYEALYLAGDLLDEAYPPRLIKAVLERFGKINILINNAGMMGLHKRI